MRFVILHKLAVVVLFDYARMNMLVNETGVKKAHLCRLLNQSPYYIRDCEKRKYDIADNELVIIAEALRTTPEYLTGMTDIKEPATKTGDGLAERISDLDLDLQEQLSEFVVLAQENQETAKRFLAFAAQELRSASQSR